MFVYTQQLPLQKQLEEDEEEGFSLRGSLLQRGNHTSLSASIRLSRLGFSLTAQWARVLLISSFHELYIGSYLPLTHSKGNCERHASFPTRAVSTLKVLVDR